ncbi:hypothetical protein NDU88_011561 [Pleurodeles waltl]|uniref:SCAN domain-containing protein 3 n=1 Tax=Pleurodeles waltl TaxID=8319 RepID=A0AAV7S432_PLEWA|nr:hypothetical protein NDU88_011561 [Pleurodeles waltl]
MRPGIKSRVRELVKAKRQWDLQDIHTVLSLDNASSPSLSFSELLTELNIAPNLGVDSGLKPSSTFVPVLPPDNHIDVFYKAISTELFILEDKTNTRAYRPKKKSPLAAHFSDKVWVAKLAYLCDIFSLLDELNLGLQGKMTTVFKLSDKVAAFKAKLELYGRRVNRGILDMFQTLAGIVGETELEHSFCQLVHDHLSLLLKEFERYFPTTKDPRTGKEWIRDPFANKSGESSMSMQEEEQLLEIANDGGLKTTFETTTLLVFWIKVMAEYPEIATTALKSLLPFPTTYLCEAGFSAVTATKTKQRNKLDISNTLRVSLSPITPRWNRLVAKKQAQGSH